MSEGNGGNLEVHRPDTHPLLSQTLKRHCRALAKSPTAHSAAPLPEVGIDPEDAFHVGKIAEA